MIAPVFVRDDRQDLARREESLIEAIAEPPRTPRASVTDAIGKLAVAAAGGRRWAFTDVGRARLRAEAEGWLEIYLRRTA